MKAAEKSVKKAQTWRARPEALAPRRQIAFSSPQIRQLRPGVTILSKPLKLGSTGSAFAPWARLPLFWRAQLSGWGLFAIVDVVNLRLLYHDFPIALSRATLILVCLVLISTGMARIYASRHLGNTLTRRAIAWIGVLSVGGGALVAGFIFAIREQVGWSLPSRDPLDEFVFPLTHYSIMLTGWSLCYFWFHAELAEQAEHRHAMAAEARALRAELEELRLQLDPHFLFNALNGVAEEIPEHPTAATTMLRDLTAYLRYSLDGINQTVATVEAEVGGLSAYLRVQRARFGDRLRVTLQIEPAAEPHRIASFLLQPLVENAIKHGRREDGLDVSIDIRLVGETLHVEIANTGTLDTKARPHRHHQAIGVANVRRRLALHYPDRHRFTLRESEAAGGKVVATLELEGEPCSGS